MIAWPEVPDERGEIIVIEIAVVFHRHNPFDQIEVFFRRIRLHSLLTSSVIIA